MSLNGPFIWTSMGAGPFNYQRSLDMSARGDGLNWEINTLSVGVGRFVFSGGGGRGGTYILWSK